MFPLRVSAHALLSADYLFGGGMLDISTDDAIVNKLSEVKILYKVGLLLSVVFVSL